MSQSHSLKKSTLNLCSTLLHSDIVDDDFISELESIIQDFKDVPVYENVKDIPDYKKKEYLIAFATMCNERKAAIMAAFRQQKS